MSKTYLDWAQRNMELNQVKNDNYFIRADCKEWLEEQTTKPKRDQAYDLIFLDPPTFSNSKRMETTLSIQEDHVALIKQAVQLLNDGGVLYFSTNFRRFKLDTEALANFTIEDISADTIPEDFSRTPKIHYCWEITR